MKNRKLVSVAAVTGWLAFLIILIINVPMIAKTGQNRTLPYLKPYIVESVELPVRDADGIAIGDITRNGKIDILTSEGGAGTTIWFEQGETWRDWTKHHIHTITGNNEIEGNALADFNGDGWYEAISLDQNNGNIYLHKHHGDPRGSWSSAVIRSGRPLVQYAMVTDIDSDGRPDLVYTWEGRSKGQGGVHWLKLTGNDPLNPEHWRDHVMVTHESAWWMVPQRVDLSGNGRADDIVFSARHTTSRNPASRPGVFWLEPASDVTQPWIHHVIDETLPHPVQVDMGDLSGEGHGLDLAVGTISDKIYWFEYSAGWKRHELSIPLINGHQPNRVWNIRTIRLGGDRDGILAPVLTRGRKNNTGALLYYEFVNDRFVPVVLRDIDYAHPMDDRILLFDLTGNGQVELIIPDSGIYRDLGHNVDLLHIFRLGRKQIDR